MISILITNICSSSKIHSSSLWAPSLASRTAVLSAALYCFRSVSECVRGDVKKSTLLYVVTLPHIPASRPIVIRQRRSQSKVTVLWKNVSVPSRGAPIWSMRIYSEVMSSGDHLVPPLFVDTVTHAGIRQLFPTFHFQCGNHIVSTANSYETHWTSFLWTTTVSTGFIEDVARPEEGIDYLTLLGESETVVGRM